MGKFKFFFFGTLRAHVGIFCLIWYYSKKAEWQPCTPVSNDIFLVTSSILQKASWRHSLREATYRDVGFKTSPVTGIYLWNLRPWAGIEPASPGTPEHLVPGWPGVLILHDAGSSPTQTHNISNISLIILASHKNFYLLLQWLICPTIF